jgi:protein-tyrosine phosphatase
MGGLNMNLRTVCFLCTGNYYRSRFAEGLFNHLARQRSLGWRARSRGLSVELTGANNVGPIAPQTLEAFRQRSIPIPEPIPYPKAAAMEDFTCADLIIALKEGEHRALVRKQFPECEHRVNYWHVHDVDQTPACMALDEIETLVRALLTSLENPGPARPGG